MAIKSYAYNSRVQLSQNFVVSEFRCKCGKTHDTILDSTLVSKLQSLVNVLGATKAIITSGYRCPAHDKAVGGAGNGQHTKGTAADVMFYKGNTIIDTKLVACRAQDLGFTGIGRIPYGTYKKTNTPGPSTAIHLDVRSSKPWYGDETVTNGTNSSVTDNFYKYYGIATGGSVPKNAPATTTKADTAVIKDLQRAINSLGYRLTVDGICGSNTINTLHKCIIDKGYKNDLVKWVQNRLNALGFSCGTADGVAGDKTMNAIHAFQNKNKLGEGYLGGKDWDVLVK